MRSIKYFREDTLNKHYNNYYGLLEFIPEEFYSRNFNINGELCDVKGYCYNSIPAFCRVYKRWSIKEESPFSYCSNRNNEKTYNIFNLQHVKVAWGACAFFFFTKRIDEQGRNRYAWNKDEYNIIECRQIYFEICYNIYKEQNNKDYSYYIANKKEEDFKKKFARYHINNELQLIERTVNTNDIFEEYNKALNIKQEAEDYVEWVKKLYLPQQTNYNEMGNYDLYILCVFNNNRNIYDLFFNRCNNKDNTSIVNEIIAILNVLGKTEKDINKCQFRECLKIHGLNVKSRSTFNSAFDYKQCKKNKDYREADIKKAEQEYREVLL